PGAAHALRARAGMARAGLGREAGCESGQGARRAAQGTPRSGAQAVAWTALVTFPKRKVTRAAAAARNKGTLPSQSQSEILRCAQDDNRKNRMTIEKAGSH
ncbi:MAG: hypothetical protein KGQ84_10650, partial [Proteobacteria bacterium]|nr:hypothetical protein [Pseudomonadota bacterium]